jgi:hypothetical protein
MWLELAPQVTARGLYDASMYTAFRMLVCSVAEAFAQAADPDSSDTARARAIQSAQAGLGKWGLSPKDRKHASKAETGDEGRRKWRRR